MAWHCFPNLTVFFCLGDTQSACFPFEFPPRKGGTNSEKGAPPTSQNLAFIAETPTCRFAFLPPRWYMLAPQRIKRTNTSLLQSQRSPAFAMPKSPIFKFLQGSSYQRKTQDQIKQNRNTQLFVRIWHLTCGNALSHSWRERSWKASNHDARRASRECTSGRGWPGQTWRAQIQRKT